MQNTGRAIRRRGAGKEMLAHYQLYLLLLPGIAYVYIFCYVPLYGIQIAFRDFYASLGFWGSPWVGLENFERFFASAIFWEIVKNTLALSLYSLAAGFPLPIVLALLLNQCPKKGFKKFVQNATYAPFFISTVVMVGMLFLFFSASGPFTKLMEAFGKAPDLYMGKPQYFRHIYVWSGVWQSVGWNSIIYIAVLTAIPPELHEAAMVDGAGKLQRIWYIDLPGIQSTAAVLLILSAGGVLSVGYEKVYLMQRTMNLSVSEVISTYIYKQGLLNVDYSYSTAIGLFNNLINFALLVTVNSATKRLSGSGLW